MLGIKKKIYMFPGRVYVTYSGILGLPLWHVYSNSLIELQQLHSCICSLNINVSDITSDGKNYYFSIDTNIYYGIQLYYIAFNFINNCNINADLIMDFSTTNIIRIVTESNLLLNKPQLLMYEVKNNFERNGLIKKLKIDTDYLANTQLYVKTYLDGFIIIREFEIINKQLMFR